MIIVHCDTGNDACFAVDALAGMSFVGLNLHRANLDNANLQNSDFSGVELRSAYLEGANLTRAILKKANLAASMTSDADFTEADLTDSMMRSGIFKKANFTRPDLSGASVGRAQFSGAILNGANLQCCDGLNDAEFVGAYSNEFTSWPVDFDPESHGVIVQKSISKVDNTFNGRKARRAKPKFAPPPAWLPCPLP